MFGERCYDLEDGLGQSNITPTAGGTSQPRDFISRHQTSTTPLRVLNLNPDKFAAERIQIEFARTTGGVA